MLNAEGIKALRIKLILMISGIKALSIKLPFQQINEH